MLDGYPDVAFAGQDGAEIGVEVTHGSPFTDEDPGPATVTVPFGGQAVATLGWDAMALSDRAAHVLYAAPRPGAPRQAPRGARPRRRRGGHRDRVETGRVTPLTSRASNRRACG